MSESLSVIETTDLYTTANYARFQVVFVRGKGVRLFDEKGRSYLDMFSGLAVSSLGHGHAGLTSAIADQASTLLHTSNLYYHEPGARLAERLVGSTFADRVFFCNSGAEANEAAIKMARRARPGRPGIISAFGSFHGRTLGALAATGQADLQEGFGPMPGGFTHVQYDDVDAIGRSIDESTAAVLVEPIVGEGGIIVPDPHYLENLRSICDEAGALLILDEVQTGVGRTGPLYAYQNSGITPNILTTAKGLAGGLPIGAVLADEQTAAAFVPGTHGSTFGANPVVCRAALAVLDALEHEGVLENVREAGSHLGARLERLAAEQPHVVEVRGKGLMWGIELDRPARPVVDAALERGLVINATAGQVVRLLPPLVITKSEIDEGIDLLETLLKTLFKEERS
jgi:predicted acetylornithine/succinylornithine family transaminase